MSNPLGLHDPSQERIFKLSIATNAVEELKTFLSEEIAIVILGEFPNRTSLFEATNIICNQRLPKPAVLWINNPQILDAVTPFLQEKAAGLSTVNFNSVLALSFKMNTEEVVYIIEKNPANWKRKMSLPEIQRAMAASISITNNQA